jgi:hypothetical protein
MENCNLKIVHYVEGAVLGWKSNGLAATENLDDDDDDDIIRPWKVLERMWKLQSQKFLNFVLKQHKTRFDDECSKLID